MANQFLDLLGLKYFKDKLQRLFDNQSERISINTTSIGMQKKNLLKNRFPSGYSRTVAGITYTVNDDGSVTVDGTCTSSNSISFPLSPADTENKITLEAGEKYVLSGCPEGGSFETYYIRLDYQTSSLGSLSVHDFGEGVEFIPSYTPATCIAHIEIEKGATLENLTFYPMLRYADVIDDTYEPYTPSVQEQIDILQTDLDSHTSTVDIHTTAEEKTLWNASAQQTTANQAAIEILNGTGEGSVEKLVTDKVSEIVAGAPEDFDTLKEMSDWLSDHEDSAAMMNSAIEQNKSDILNITQTLSENDVEITEIAAQVALNQTAIGCSIKNLLKNTASTTEKNGITFIINDDGSVTASGTASVNTQLDIGKFSLTAGTEYILSGCPDGGSESSYYLYGLYTSNWAGLGGKDTGSGYKFTAQWSGEVVFRVYITSGTIIDNMTFYPMLRYAAIEDATYETYTPSLQEQIDNLNSEYTDTKVEVTLNNTSKAYLLGTTTTPTSTATGVTAVADTGVYLDHTDGRLSATSFKAESSSGQTWITPGSIRNIVPEDDDWTMGVSWMTSDASTSLFTFGLRGSANPSSIDDINYMYFGPSYTEPWLQLTADNATFNRTVTAPTFKGDLTGNADTSDLADVATQVRSTSSSLPSTGVTYAIAFHEGITTGNISLLNNNNFRLQMVNGTTNTEGRARIHLGNNVSSGTEGNATGMLLMFSDTSHYGVLRPISGLPGDRTWNLPNASGTIALTSDLSKYLPLTGNAVSASKLETPVTINGVEFDGSTAISLAKVLYDGTGTTTAVRLVEETTDYDALYVVTTYGSGLVSNTGGQFPYAQTNLLGTLYGSKMGSISITVSGTVCSTSASNYELQVTSSNANVVQLTSVNYIVKVIGLKWL